jgi:hypothetical protein
MTVCRSKTKGRLKMTMQALRWKSTQQAGTAVSPSQQQTLAKTRECRATGYHLKRAAVKEGEGERGGARASN